MGLDHIPLRMSGSHGDGRPLKVVRFCPMQNSPDRNGKMVANRTGELNQFKNGLAQWKWGDAATEMGKLDSANNGEMIV